MSCAAGTARRPIVVGVGHCSETYFMTLVLDLGSTWPWNQRFLSSTSRTTASTLGLGEKNTLADSTILGRTSTDCDTIREWTRACARHARVERDAYFGRRQFGLRSLPPMHSELEFSAPLGGLARFRSVTLVADGWALQEGGQERVCAPSACRKNAQPECVSRVLATTARALGVPSLLC